MKHEEHYLRKLCSIIALLMMSCLAGFAQGKIQIRGTIMDEHGETINWCFCSLERQK